MTTAAIDAGPLIHLAEIGQLSRLDLFNALFVPEAVRKEVVREDRLSERQFEHIQNLRLRRVDASAVSAFMQAHRLRGLHAGESECLYICHKEGIDLLITDDLAVRDAAAALGLTPVGSLGIVVRAYRLGQLDLAEAEMCILNLHKVSSLFVTPALVDYVLGQLRDQR